MQVGPKKMHGSTVLPFLLFSTLTKCNLALFSKEKQAPSNLQSQKGQFLFFHLFLILLFLFYLLRSWAFVFLISGYFLLILFDAVDEDCFLLYTVF